MKGLVITSKGIEEMAALEIKEIIDVNCKVEECAVSFDFGNFEDLCMLCYKCQSADRVLYLIGDFEFQDFFEELERFIEKIKLEEWISKLRKFKVECVRIGNHNFKSVDAGAKITELLSKKDKSKKLGMRDYDLIFFAYIVNNKCYLGIDFAGFELNKRAYKIFLHSGSLRGTIAYALLRESGFEKKDSLLDPFSRDGVIAIEAALYASGFPINYYKKEKFAFLKFSFIDSEKFFANADKKIIKPEAEIYSFDHLFKYVDYSRKNAKIAGIDKHVNFSRVEIEWLDIKFRKETVDRVITNPPSSRNANMGKIYNEFFYQAEFILKRDGAVAVITKIPEFVIKHAQKHNFGVAKERKVWSGEQELNILVLKKKTI